MSFGRENVGRRSLVISLFLMATTEHSTTESSLEF